MIKQTGQPEESSGIERQPAALHGTTTPPCRGGCGWTPTSDICTISTAGWTITSTDNFEHRPDSGVSASARRAAALRLIQQCPRWEPHMRKAPVTLPGRGSNSITGLYPSLSLRPTAMLQTFPRFTNQADSLHIATQRNGSQNSSPSGRPRPVTLRTHRRRDLLVAGHLRRPPQAISPEHDALTGTLPGPVGQRRRITTAPVAPRKQPMSVEQTDRDEGQVACAAVRCAGPRPGGAAPAAGVRTMRCGETMRARMSRTAIGGSPAAARAG